MQALESGTLPRGFPDVDESSNEAVQFPTLPLALRYVLLRAGWNPVNPDPLPFVHALVELAPMSPTVANYCRRHYGRLPPRWGQLGERILEGWLDAYRRGRAAPNGDPLFYPLDEGARYARETFGGEYLQWVPVLWKKPSHHHRVPQEAVRYLIFDARLVFYGVFPLPLAVRNLILTVEAHGGKSGLGPL